MTLGNRRTTQGFDGGRSRTSYCVSAPSASRCLQGNWEGAEASVHIRAELQHVVEGVWQLEPQNCGVQPVHIRKLVTNGCIQLESIFVLYRFPCLRLYYRCYAVIVIPSHYELRVAAGAALAIPRAVCAPAAVACALQVGFCRRALLFPAARDQHNGVSQRAECLAGGRVLGCGGIG